jgi:hypothetical protein
MDSSIHLRGAWQEVVPARTAPWQWGLVMQFDWQGRRAL